MCNDRLSLQDTAFVENVEKDIHYFLENCFKKKVLVFPPFSNFRRFLIHNTIENRFENLKSFSIGEGEERRTVVCFSSDFKSTFASDCSNAVFSGKSVELQSIQRSGVCECSQNIQKRVKRARTMPSVTLYRPPAARKLEQNGNLSSLQMSEIMKTSQEKHKVSNPEESKRINQNGKRNDSNEMSVFRNAITSIRAQNKVPKYKSVENAAKKTEVESRLNKAEEISKNAVQNKQRRPDIQVYVPKGRRSASFGNEQKSVCENNPCKDSREVLEEKIITDYCKTHEKESKRNLEDKRICRLPRLEVTSKNNDDNSLIEMACGTKSENSDSRSVENIAHCDSDGSKKSDDSKMNQLNPDECDWESMFDDSGECLDPSLMEQLTTAVGEVTIEKPKSNYNAYKNKSLDMVADEFPHVIEIYNFPPEFQLHDLMTVFSQFKNSGFEIKWVDDTHALGIFSSSAIVSEVLEFYHPFVKTRSLKEGTPLSKMKARRSAEFLQPYKPRPETCSALARRLVTGALGVKLPTFREEREAEKKILTKAREKKRLEAKQRENAWEGTFS